MDKSRLKAEAVSLPVWDGARGGDALAALVQEARLPHVSSMVTGTDVDTAKFGTWVTAMKRLGELMELQLQWARSKYQDYTDVIARTGPGLLCVKTKENVEILVVVDGNHKRARVLTPERKVVALPTHQIVTWLGRDIDRSTRKETLGALDGLRVDQVRKERIVQRLCGIFVGHRTSNNIAVCTVRPERAKSLWTEVRRARLTWSLLSIVAVRFLGTGLDAGAWGILGYGALSGHFDAGWLMAWLVMLVASVPVTQFGAYQQRGLKIRVGTLFKEWLLSRILATPVDSPQRQGVGNVMGATSEASNFESIGLQVVMGGVLGAVDAVITVVVLSLGAAGVLHLVGFLFWLGLTLAVGVGRLRAIRREFAARLSVTRTFTDRVVGHRTRLVQCPPEHWYDGEDASLNEYVAATIRADNSGIWLTTVVPKGWFIVGLALLVPAFVSGQAPLALAIGIAGLMSARAAFGSIGGAMESLGRAAIAWNVLRKIVLIDEGSSEAREVGSAISEPKKEAALETRGLTFLYPGRNRAALENCSVRIEAGERVLLTGPSGGGKTTLATLLAGVRKPTNGLLMLSGLDPAVLGKLWRRSVVLVPQFHENHVFANSFMFNCSIGRGWPIDTDDEVEIGMILEELGLAKLIERMPLGLKQFVGDNGWRLSHGERSRMFLARALAQKPSVLILDESFGALDPETLQVCANAVLKHTKTLIVIAHP